MAAETSADDEARIEALREEADRLEDEWAGAEDSLADPALASLQVTGRFDMTDARKLALKLGAALDLKVEFGANGPILGAKSE